MRLAFRSCLRRGRVSCGFDGVSASPAEFLNGFEAAVTARDWSTARRYFDPAYVSEQHDDFLKGRTDQFFVELLGVYKQCGNVTHANCLGRVKWMRRQRTPGPAAAAGVPVRFLLMLDGEEKPLPVTLYLKLGPSPRKFSLVGPVG